MSRWRKEVVAGEVDLAVWRSGEGEPLVCLHGITAQHRSFNALAKRLGYDRELIGVDLRGRGDSAKPDSGYGLETHARDVFRVLEWLGLDRAVLCGHSMGAFVATKAALLEPGRVRALVLLDGAWPRVETSEEEQKVLDEGLARAFSRLDMTFESVEAYLDFWFPGQGLAPEDLDPDLADYYLYDLEEVDGGYRPKAHRPAAEKDAASLAAEAPDAQEMRNVSCPVMLVRAKEGFFPGSDPLVPDEVRDDMTKALDIRLETALEASHYSMMFDPAAKRAASEVEEFLRSLE
ncbi:MAG: alpha/beta fold hydrolase [Rubrobacteraceae bacterium]